MRKVGGEYEIRSQSRQVVQDISRCCSIRAFVLNCVDSCPAVVLGWCGASDGRLPAASSRISISTTLSARMLREDFAFIPWTTAAPAADFGTRFTRQSGVTDKRVASDRQKASNWKTGGLTAIGRQSSLIDRSKLQLRDLRALPDELFEGNSCESG